MLSLMTPPYRLHPCRGWGEPTKDVPQAHERFHGEYAHDGNSILSSNGVMVLLCNLLCDSGRGSRWSRDRKFTTLPTQLSELTSTPPCFHSSLACPAGTVDGGAIPEGLYRATHSPRRDEGSGLAGSGMAGRMTGSGMAGSGLAVAAQLTRGSSLTSCWCERVTGFFICAFCGKRGGPVGGAVG